MKDDDFCSKHDPVVQTRAEFDEDALRQITVMAKQLRNGYPILPLPENLAALRAVLTDEEAPTDTTADHPQG